MAERFFLVADPDPLQRQLIDLLLADEGAEVVGVSTARALLEYLRERTPHLIVVAQELPDLDGTDVATRVKAVARLAKVPLILTVNAEGQILAQSLRDRAMSAGVDLLLPKPLGDKNFRDRARRLMAAGSKAASRPAGTTQVIEETIRDLTGPALRASDPGVTPAARVTDGGARQHDLAAENQRLKGEAAQLRQLVDKLRAEIAELKREPPRRRGPFGRRRD